MNRHPGWPAGDGVLLPQRNPEVTSITECVPLGVIPDFQVFEFLKVQRINVAIAVLVSPLRMHASLLSAGCLEV